MSQLLDTIKTISHQISENYLLTGDDMNDTLIALFQDGSIKNIEILKRICEQANQNVYLGLFNNPDTDKSNIVFDKADSEMISGKIEESEEAMKDYNTPPKDFRSQLEIAVVGDQEKTAESNSHLKELNEVVEKRQVLGNFLNKLGMMKTASSKEAEEAVSDMANDAKVMISNGESLGDIAKIASRHVKENLEGDVVKVAQCYEYIRKELIKSNFNVKTGFTKLSSQRINPKANVLKSVERFSRSIAKIAGLDEMMENVSKRLSWVLVSSKMFMLWFSNENGGSNL